MAIVNVATRGTDSVKILGKNVLLFINAGVGATVEKPNWLLIGGQRNSGAEMSADEIDVSDKTSEGWGDTLSGQKTWSMGLESIMVIGDLGVEAIKQAFLNDQEIQILRWQKDGSAIMGWCSVTEFSDDAPHDDAVSLTGTLNGRGAPQFLTGIAYPGGVKDLVATPGVNSVELTWTPLVDATAIKTQYGTNGISWSDAPVITLPGDSSETVPGLTAGMMYYFRLVVTGGNRAGFSNTATATPI